MPIIINTEARCGVGEFPCPYCVDGTCRCDPPMVIQHLFTLSKAVEIGDFPPTNPSQPACGSSPNFFIIEEGQQGQQ